MDLLLTLNCDACEMEMSFRLYGCSQIPSPQDVAKIPCGVCGGETRFVELAEDNGEER